MSTPLRALGFCGVDDSVHPHHIILLAHSYPQIEFGILFRPDQEGQPRYATMKWVQQLVQSKFSTMKLAAHLCGSHVNDLFDPKKKNTTLLDQLIQWGFQRVQINATAVNGVNTTHLDQAVPVLWNLVQQYPNIEFIIQTNAETEPLWKGLLLEYQQNNSNNKTNGRFITNLSMLVDESKGTGQLPTKKWPAPTKDTPPFGYAGGIGPGNIQQVLHDILQVVVIDDSGEDTFFWIDMESSLRSIRNGQDIFDLEKCFQIIDVVCDMGLMKRPNYLGGGE